MGKDEGIISDVEDMHVPLNDPNDAHAMNYHTGDVYADEEVYEDDKRKVGKASSLLASYNVICTVVGTGLLQLPYGLEESGWIGVGILLGVALVASYTAVMLIKCMNPPSGKKLYTYSEVGQEAFGKVGSTVVDIFLHATLIGVATIYLILAGGNLSTLLATVPWPSAAGYTVDVLNISATEGILIVVTLMWLHVWLKTLHEVGFLSAFNVMVAVFLEVTVITVILLNLPSSAPDYDFVNTASYGLSLAGAFVSFSFSYGAHAVLPTVYESMAKPQQFNVMITTTFIAILGFYLPMACIGYGVYGTGTLSPIYNNLCEDGQTCSYGAQLGKWLSILLITAHVMLSYAIVLNPTERMLERVCGTDDLKQPKNKLYGVVLRTCVVAITVVLAFWIPDFGDFLNLVSACTNTATTFVFPCLFHMKLFWPEVKNKPLIIAWDVFIIVASIIAGVFGAIFAIFCIACNLFGFCTDWVTC